MACPDDWPDMDDVKIIEQMGDRPGLGFFRGSNVSHKEQNGRWNELFLSAVTQLRANYKTFMPVFWVIFHEKSKAAYSAGMFIKSDGSFSSLEEINAFLVS